MADAAELGDGLLYGLNRQAQDAPHCYRPQGIAHVIDSRQSRFERRVDLSAAFYHKSIPVYTLTQNIIRPPFGGRVETVGDDVDGGGHVASYGLGQDGLQCRVFSAGHDVTVWLDLGEKLTEGVLQPLV